MTNKQINKINNMKLYYLLFSAIVAVILSCDYYIYANTHEISCINTYFKSEIVQYYCCDLKCDNSCTSVPSNKTYDTCYNVKNQQIKKRSITTQRVDLPRDNDQNIPCNNGYHCCEINPNEYRDSERYCKYSISNKLCELQCHNCYEGSNTYKYDDKLYTINEKFNKNETLKNFDELWRFLFDYDNKCYITHLDILVHDIIFMPVTLMFIFFGAIAYLLKVFYSL